MIRKKDLQFQINFLKRELERVDKELAEARAAAGAAENEARAATAEVARLRDVIDTELLPDDSAARQAKLAVDRFNQGIFNVLTFGDKEGKA
jgi:regulator of replication initiation timing